MAESGDNALAERQLVVFCLATDKFGVDITSVREIIRMQSVSRVPNGPEFLEGVINLRGRICPVVDLRRLFSVPVTDATDESRIIVIDVAGAEVGAVVDSVAEVLRVPLASLTPAPNAATGSEAKVVDEISSVDDRLILLVDLQAVLSAEGSDEADEALAAAA